MLHDLGQLVGEQRPAPGAHRIVGAATEEGMLARRERTCLEQAAELVGVTVRVNPDPAEVRPESPFHRVAQGTGDRLPAGARLPDGLARPGVQRTADRAAGALRAWRRRGTTTGLGSAGAPGGR